MSDLQICLGYGLLNQRKFMNLSFSSFLGINPGTSFILEQHILCSSVSNLKLFSGWIRPWLDISDISRLHPV